MQSIITFFFIFLLAIYVYGYFMYSHKIRRNYIKPCSTIYILDDGLSNINYPTGLPSDAFEKAKQIDSELIKMKN